jgi:hypothetical protein
MEESNPMSYRFVKHFPLTTQWLCDPGNSIAGCLQQSPSKWWRVESYGTEEIDPHLVGRFATLHDAKVALCEACIGPDRSKWPDLGGEA